MRDSIYIKPFDLENDFGRFKGGHLFKDENEENGFLLNPENGCSIILSSELYEQVLSQKIDEPLAFKMIQRGLVMSLGSKPVMMRVW